MELTIGSSKTVKIKGKTASVVIDPAGKAEAQIIIATKPLESLDLANVSGQRLIVNGPGEYEAGGISITGRPSKNGTTSYLILDTSKILLVSSADVKDVPDDEEYDCLLINVTGELSDDAFAAVHATCTVLYGDLAMVTVKAENQEKVSKVNLKKTAEVAGKIFLLE